MIEFYHLVIVIPKAQGLTLTFLSLHLEGLCLILIEESFDHWKRILFLVKLSIDLLFVFRRLVDVVLDPLYLHV